MLKFFMRRKRIVSSIGTPANAYNWNPVTQFANFKASKQAAKAGTGFCRGVFAGDSTNAGVGAAANAWRQKSVSAQLVKYINSLSNSFLNASFDNFLGCGNDLKADNVRITGYPNTATTSGAQGAGGPAWQFNVNEGIDFTLEVPKLFNRVRIGIIANSNGVCDVGVDGGALSGTTFVDDNSGNIFTKIYTVARGQHSVVNIRGTAGTTLLCMVECYDTLAPTIEIFNGGSGGADSSALAGSTTGYGELPGLLAVQPNIAVINYGINDGNSLSRPKAQYKANILNGVQAFKAINCDVLLLVPTPIATGSNMESGTPNPLWQDYRDALQEISMAQNVPLINLHDRYVSFATQNAKNPSWMYDNLHPNALLYADQGAFLGNILVNV